LRHGSEHMANPLRSKFYINSLKSGAIHFTIISWHIDLGETSSECSKLQVLRISGVELVSSVKMFEHGFKCTILWRLCSKRILHMLEIQMPNATKRIVQQTSHINLGFLPSEIITPQNHEPHNLNFHGPSSHNPVHTLCSLLNSVSELSPLLHWNFWHDTIVTLIFFQL